MRNLKLLKSIYSSFIPFITGLILFCSSHSYAQTGSGSAPNVRTYVDSNSVDLLTGERIFSFHLVSIGAGGDGLSANVVSTRRGNYNIDRHNYWGAINEYSGVYIVNIGEGAEDFDLSGSTFTSRSQSGSTLTLSGNTYTYTTADGTVALFTNQMTSTFPVKANKALLTSVTAANGQKLYLDYDYQPLGSNKAYLRSVRNNLGYQLKFSDEEAKVMAINNREEYCDPTAENCGASTTLWAETDFERLPELASTTGDFESMDFSQHDPTEFRSFSRTNQEITNVEEDDLGYIFDAQDRVTSVDVNGAVWSYSYSDSGGQRTTTISQPLGGSRVIVSDIVNKIVLSDTDALGRTAAYTYDTYNRLKTSTAPSGVRTEYDYDLRGNITETRVVATNGAILTSKAGFPATCSNPKTCNKPSWTEDTKGKRTDYTYDAAHGGVRSVMGPAPAAGVDRPRILYYYSQRKAKVKNQSGALIDADPIWRLATIRTCATASICINSANERVVIQSYNALKNLAPSARTVRSGDSSVKEISWTYFDIYGNLTETDGPLYGTADRSYFFYDGKEKRRIGAIGPDPDGAGSLKRQAVRYNFDNAGQLQSTDSGVTTSYTLSALNSMTVKNSTDYTYDVYGRRERVSVKIGNTIEAVSQYRFDIMGRVLCRAQRMNKDDMVSMPEACTLDDPKDRISKVAYNLTGQATTQWSAYGSPDQATATNIYWANGNLRYIRDQKGRYTYYYYDNFNRHYKTYYPRKDGVAGLSGDYTQKYFDQYGRQDSARLRDGTIVDFLRDDLNRIYHVDAPNTSDDYSYSFDLFGRVTMSTKGGVTSVANSYDALSRLKTEANEFGTTSYDYDGAGRMTKLTYPGTGLYVNYDYNNVGAVTKIRENGLTSGAGVLAQYTYDDQGRRTAMIRGNGHITSYDYDDLSRLTDMTQDAAGTANDLTLSYEYNPAGQITRQERSSTAYDWDIDNLESSSFITNGLNQAISMYSGPITYDDRGNLTQHSGKTYDYDIFNKLTSVSGTSAQTGTVLDVTLEYDAKGRLNKEIDSGTETRFAYSGSQLIAEYNQYNTPTARYVHGPGSDEPIVMFNDPMNISGQQETLWMMSDTRGSIIGYTNASGAVTNKNTYSPEGVPGDNNVGRFGYTGQMWLEGAELYHYKARAYDPQLGRFLQADPIGYGDGLNMYAYVGGDAINRNDPSGLAYRCTTTAIKDEEGNWVPGSEITKCRYIGGGFGMIIYNGLIRGNEFPRFEGGGGFDLASELQALKEFYDSCVVSEAEGSFGIQAGVKGKLGPFDVSVYGDAGTNRANLGTDAIRRGNGLFDTTHTQGGEFGYGLRGTILDLTFRRGRETDESGYFPLGSKSTGWEKPFTTDTQRFVGIGGEVALLAGVAFKFGLNLPDNGSHTCK